ncbi:MAG: DUF6978 family protein [Candidatus Brocadiales bacterium]
MLTQDKVNALLALKKKTIKKGIYDFPQGGKHLTIPIISLDEREAFLLDVNRRSIRLTKCTYQERYQGPFILVRLDVDGPPHPNPEVEVVPLPYLAVYNGITLLGPHLHIYVEGFMDKWAIPAPEDTFSRTHDLYDTLFDFFNYCNIVEPPIIQKSVL